MESKRERERKGVRRKTKRDTKRESRKYLERKMIKNGLIWFYYGFPNLCGLF